MPKIRYMHSLKRIHKIGFFILFAYLIYLCSTNISAAQTIAQKTLSVTASSLILRTANKSVLCSLPNGTEVIAVGRHSDGVRVKVKVKSKGCPANGYVDSKYLSGTQEVTASGLKFRSKPEKSEESELCTLERGTGVKPYGDTITDNSGMEWIRVNLTKDIAGCPTRGFLAKKYVSSAEISALPLVKGTNTDCAECDALAKKQKNKAEDVLDTTSRQIGEKIDDNEKESPKKKDKHSLRKLASEAEAAAAKCRSIAPHVCKRITGSRKPCGKRCGTQKSKGWCKAAVKEAVRNTYGYTIPGISAYEAKDFLERKMTKLKINKCKLAPVGAICLYKSYLHPYGHIEIKTGKNRYCSDYCSAAPASLRTRELIGVYYP